ncbi:MAG TPA: hypothetical protein VI522_04325, partial [Gammaproteobacteria bacterium]|nr:hypothetical protein [Gammaproteobacteria bacterium]
PNHDWSQTYVFKPTVSAGASNVFMIKSAEQAEKIYQEYFRHQHNTLLVQPFIEEICLEGEWSLIFFSGVYSHGVLKKPEAGDMLVKHSRENQHTKPSKTMIEAVEAIYQRLLSVQKEQPLYTRIDVVQRAQGLCVMEIEQIEPYLYLHARSDAANNLVSGILQRL